MGKDAIDQAKKFYNHTEFDGVIMTKMDVDTKGGSAISTVSVTCFDIFGRACMIFNTCQISNVDIDIKTWIHVSS